MSAIPLPPLDTLQAALAYDAISGRFTWLQTLSNAAISGGIAGSANGRGYVFICVNGRRLRAHRLAWLYMTGRDPGDLEIDHRDRNPSNNAWSNLRLATRKQNNENTSTQRNNTSTVRGVSFDKTTESWEAYISHNKKRIHLGRFRDLASAAAARESAQTKLFSHGIAPKEPA